MHKVLNEIIVSTKREVASRKSKIRVATPGVTTRKGDVVLIAEIKLASPSAGILGSRDEVVKRAISYAQAGTDVISVVTEKNFFHGDLEMVPEIKQHVSVPVLQKDFVVDKYQIYEAKRLGSDFLLLIARIVSESELKQFVDLCLQLGVEPIVEINSEEDLEKAIKTQAKIIAVNARDLDSFEVNLNKACQLMQKIPEKFIKLGFSGIVSRKEVEEYKAVGAKAVLVGTQLMKSDNVERLIKELKNVS